jgi:hypothetical protein
VGIVEKEFQINRATLRQRNQPSRTKRNGIAKNKKGGHIWPPKAHPNG